MKKEIPGYKGKYLADTNGNIWRVYKNATTQMKPSLNKDGILSIKLMDNFGLRREQRVHLLIARTFLTKKPEGYSVFHKNRIKTDNSLYNLSYCSPSDLGKKTGGQSRRKAVSKIDCKTQEVVEVYSSAREAGRKNYMSYQTIMDRCNGKVKSLTAPDGFIYKWDITDTDSKDFREGETNGKV